MDEVVAAYDAAAGRLAARCDALPGGGPFRGIEALLPTRGLALDVGAGSGRDARWLAERGLDVVAVEPAAGLRAEGERRAAHRLRWIDDRLPALDRVHRLAVSFDLVVMSAVWQHVVPADRARAFRKLASLLRPGGVLALTLRAGPAPAGFPMHVTSVGEVEGLARVHGLEILRVVAAENLQGRPEVSWTTVALRMPDDGTGALPLVRGIVLGDDKSSTYKLGLLRAVAMVAERNPAAAEPPVDGADAVEIPLGLVALFWVRMYLPLVRLGLPQLPRTRGPDGMGFAGAGFRGLVSDDLDASELRVGALFGPERSVAVLSAIREAAATIARMPAYHTRFPNSEDRVFEATRGVSRRRGGLALDLPGLRGFGALVVPGHLWRALSRHGAWIEPMLVAEWSRLTRRYAQGMGLDVAPGVVEAALEWREPERGTGLARRAAERLLATGLPVECVWSGRALATRRLDMDHCLPWAVWPCGDLWNLAPSTPSVNRHEKRDRLPSAALLARSRDRFVAWWERAYIGNDALRARFDREVAASLPVLGTADLPAVYAALDWRRLRLLQDQRVPEWAGPRGREPV